MRRRSEEVLGHAPPPVRPSTGSRSGAAFRLCRRARSGRPSLPEVPLQRAARCRHSPGHPDRPEPRHHRHPCILAWTPVARQRQDPDPGDRPWLALLRGARPETQCRSDLEVKGYASFIRLGKERSLLWDTLVPRLENPAAARLELKKCRQAVPLTPDEMFQGYLAGSGVS